MQINNKRKNYQQDNIIEDDEDNTRRDLELENIAGNLMIAEYQVDKLRRRLSQQVEGAIRHSFGIKKTSAHTFKYDDKWYKLSIKIEDLSLNNNNNVNS